MNIDELREVLKSAKTIDFSRHFYEPKVQIRGISEEEIKSNLKNPKKLTSFEDQGEDSEDHKYALLFSKSGKYDLRIVVKLKNNSINVITTHIQNIKRRKVIEQWLKKRR